MTRLKLGEILLKQGLITQQQLDQAISAQRHDRSRIGEIFIKQGIIKELDIVLALSKQLAIPYVSRESGLLKPQSPDLLNLISKEFSQKNLVLPLSKNKNVLTCAVFDPLDLVLLDNLKKITKCEIKNFGKMYADKKAQGKVVKDLNSIGNIIKFYIFGYIIIRD